MSESAALRHLFLIQAGLQLDGGEAAQLLESEAFEQQLAALWQSGCAAWPDVTLPAEAFVRHLAERLSDGESISVFLSSVNAPDLFLACACLRRVPSALTAFERHLLTQVPRFLGRIDGTPAFVDEITQQLREKLFVAPEGTAPKIADYSGRGPLAVWLRVVACRTALNLKRQRADVPLDDEPADRAAPSLRPSDIELDYLRQRYRDDFRAALRDAIAALPDDRRDVLRFYFLSGLSLEKIGALFHVHQTTVTRWLAHSREAILRETRRLLGLRLRLSPTEFDSLAGLLRSELDLSLSVLLPPSGS